MAFSRNHSALADGTFSATGATNWNAAHALSGAEVGGIPYCPTATTETTSSSFTFDGTTLSVPAITLSSLTSGRVALIGASGVITDSSKYLWSSTAGEGLTIAAGTATTDVNALSLTQTFNQGSTVFTSIKLVATNTASDVKSKLLDLRLSGASVSTFCVQRNGNFGSITDGFPGLALNVSASAIKCIDFSGNNRGQFSDAAWQWMAVTGGGFGWGTSATDASTGAATLISTGGTNQVIFSGGAPAPVGGGGAVSRAEINKAVTGFTDGAAKTVFTLTIPNAAHSASYMVQITGSIGAGGAVGANEASATNCYVVTITRTAGVNAVAGISAAFGASTAAVAGATTVTCTAALAAVSGAVGAVNTIDIQATITKGGGASANHTCVATASLLNANASGITIS